MATVQNTLYMRCDAYVLCNTSVANCKQKIIEIAIHQFNSIFAIDAMHHHKTYQRKHEKKHHCIETDQSEALY